MPRMLTVFLTMTLLSGRTTTPSGTAVDRLQKPAADHARALAGDDIAAMLPVQLGSGVNLLGYYMFHGGRNPVREGGPALEESSLSGGYNDTPRINYDFQAPLGPEGQQRPVMGKMRPWHYFLAEHGPRLATMTPRRPERTPGQPRHPDPGRRAKLAARRNRPAQRQNAHRPRRRAQAYGRHAEQGGGTASRSQRPLHLLRRPG